MACILFFVSVIPKDAWSARASSFFSKLIEWDCSTRLNWRWPTKLIFFTTDDNDSTFGPELAIDGVFTNEAWGFFQPKYGSPVEWLEINMGREETLCKFQLYFRADETSPGRITNLDVRVGNDQASQKPTGNGLCAKLISLPLEAIQYTMRCSSPLTGKYVVIWAEGETIWEINEVFAYST